MQALKKQRLTGYVTLVLLAGLALSGGTAFANTVTGTATLTAGSLTETSTAAPSISATLDGTDQTKPYTLPMLVGDMTGTGTGWNMTITSTTFSTGVSGYTLPTTASMITGITTTCVAGTTCTSPTNAIGYPLGIPAAGTAPTAVKLFNAAATTGMGQFTVTPSVSVALPASSYAGSYTSTITLAVVSGP